MADKVTCENCGFLALRNRFTGELDEAPQAYRWRAEIPTLRDPQVSGVQSFPSSFYHYPYTGVPICLVRAHPLHNEFTDQERASESEIFTALTKERNCAERGLFTEWQQGFTPKEHREMLDRERMLRWQEEREQADKKARKRDFWTELLIISTIAILAALLGGWAQATFQREPVIINNTIWPTPQAIIAPSIPGTLSSPTPAVSLGSP